MISNPVTLDATIAHLTTNDILKESCDDVANSSCNQDQAMFKGIWMKHLQYYLDAVPGSVSKYAHFIGAQESAVVHYATGEGYAVENVWYGGSQVRLCILTKHPCSQAYAGRHHILGSVAGQWLMHTWPCLPLMLLPRTLVSLPISALRSMDRAEDLHLLGDH